RPDVAEVIRQAFELGHERTQPSGARWRLEAHGGLDGAGEGDAVGDDAVAGHASGEARRPIDLRASHQGLDALVDVAQPLLEADHGLAGRGEAEMAGLDD